MTAMKCSYGLNIFTVEDIFEADGVVAAGEAVEHGVTAVQARQPLYLKTVYTAKHQSTRQPLYLQTVYTAKHQSTSQDPRSNQL